MRCISAEETLELFGPLGFSVSDEHRYYRRDLNLCDNEAQLQTRLAAGLPANSVQFESFLEEVNAWFPSDRRRLLWISHFEHSGLSRSSRLFTAARLGLGEARDVGSAPGQLFDSHPYAEMDQLELSEEHLNEAGLLVGFMLNLFMSRSDGWLLAESCRDRVEIWEGYIIFYSSDVQKIDGARALLQRYGCKEWRKD